MGLLHPALYNFSAHDWMSSSQSQWMLHGICQQLTWKYKSVGVAFPSPTVPVTPPPHLKNTMPVIFVNIPSTLFHHSFDSYELQVTLSLHLTDNNTSTSELPVYVLFLFYCS
jgi:hypothetical protein